MAFTKIPAATNRTVDFTSSGTFTVPSGVYSAEFLVVGAGGGGGGADNSVATRSAAGGGGGGGAVKYVTLVTTPGNSYTITIGAKGTGGVVGAAGSNGGISEVVLSGTTLIKCGGGVGGEGISSADARVAATLPALPAGAGGIANSSATVLSTAGGGGSSADYSSLGYGEATRGEGSASGSAVIAQNFGKLGINGFGNGGGGARSSSSSLAANAGQAAFGGGIGALAANTVSATDIVGGAATLFGSGGGGGVSALSTTGAAGGNGADGLVRITYFA